MSFLGVTVHWVAGAELQNVTLDFIKFVLTFISTVFLPDVHNSRLNKAHTGQYLAAKLIKSLKDYAIEKKVTGHLSVRHVSTWLTIRHSR